MVDPQVVRIGFNTKSWFDLDEAREYPHDLSETSMYNWLVVWNMFYFPLCMG